MPLPPVKKKNNSGEGSGSSPLNPLYDRGYNTQRNIQYREGFYGPDPDPYTLSNPEEEPDPAQLIIYQHLMPISTKSSLPVDKCSLSANLYRFAGDQKFQENPRKSPLSCNPLTKGGLGDRERELFRGLLFSLFFCPFRGFTGWAFGCLSA